MKKIAILIPALIICIVSFAQTCKEYHLTSLHQIDKTQNGNIVKSNRKVNIYFKDPMPITKESDDLKNKPTGTLFIKYEGINDLLSIEVKYFGSTYTIGNATNQAFYGITKTNTDYNAFIFVNKIMVVDGISYKHLLIIANMDSNTGGISTNTIYCCN